MDLTNGSDQLRAVVAHTGIEKKTVEMSASEIVLWGNERNRITDWVYRQHLTNRQIVEGMGLMATTKLYKVIDDLRCPICDQHPTMGPSVMKRDTVMEWCIECDQDNHHLCIYHESRESLLETWKQMCDRGNKEQEQ